MSKITIIEGNTDDKDKFKGYLIKGERGYSAYEIAVQNGYQGTEEEWVNSFLNAKNYYNKSEVNNIAKKKVFYFDTVALMKGATNLQDGDFVITKGYYTANDGGGANYLIRSKTVGDVEDNGFINFIGDNLTAELIIENNTINIKSLGARSQYKNEKYDIHDYIISYINYINNKKKRYRLYIPSGYYHTTQCDFDSEIGFDIFGDFIFTTDINMGTSIAPINNNQDYILNIGSENKYTSSSRMTNIRFTTLLKRYDEETEKYVTSDLFEINEACLNLLHVTTSLFDNLFFMGIKGCALSVSSCWELYFPILNFRYIDNLGDAIFKFLPNNYSLTQNPNISACTFENVMFENTHGSLFSVEANCSFGNNKFGTINFENGKWEASYLSGTYTNYDGTNQDVSITGEECMFKLKSGCSFDVDINDIVCNNVRNFYFTRDNINYSFLKFFRTANSTQVNAIVNNINIIGMKNDITVFSTGGADDVINPKSSFVLNNIILTNSDNNILFNLKKMPYIRCGNIVRGSGITDNKYAYSIDGSMLPFYKSLIVNKNTPGKIFTIDGSLCDNNFSTKISNDEDYPDSYYLVSNTDNIIIRAQIPNGTTTTIKLKVGEYEGTVNLVGTGVFKNYKIENIHNIINYPTADGIVFSRMIISKVSGEEDSYFDCYCYC